MLFRSLSNYNHRIGAWVSTNALNYLLSKLQDPQVGLTLLQELPKRGVRLNKRTFELVQLLADASTDEENKQALLALAAGKTEDAK